MAWFNTTDLEYEEPSKREIEEIQRNLRARKKARFYADENFPATTVELLRRSNLDVVTVLERGKAGHPDENHLAEARKLGRIFLTCDRDFLDDRRFPLLQSPALVVFNFGSGTATEVQEALFCLNGILPAPQFYDTSVKIHASREEWTEIRRFPNGEVTRTRYRVRNYQLQEWVEP